jgi:hypothetical protein
MLKSATVAAIHTILYMITKITRLSRMVELLRVLSCHVLDLLVPTPSLMAFLGLYMRRSPPRSAGSNVSAVQACVES